MCGILGWTGPQVPDFSPAAFAAALDTLSHRGPDDSGIWSADGVRLGHRRLSIIDLSSGGHQPMVSRTTGSVLVYNGEIYNYVELAQDLRQEGVEITGGSDSGVLQAAIDHWGIDAVRRFNGMWAFALWQPRHKRLILSRDRFGVKPLYYRAGSDGVAFASEPKGLLALYPSHRRIAEDVLLDFLANNQLLSGGRSFYEGISLVPPGHNLVIDAKAPSARPVRYWSYPEPRSQAMSGDQAVEEFTSLFNDAVRIRLRSDVPVGLTLSGGLDSTAILAGSHTASGKALKCFTSVYSATETGELSWARKACQPYDAELESVSAPPETWLAVMRDVCWHMDGPGYSPAVYPLWCLMKRARGRSIPVLLEGQGADEALAGYPQYAVLEFLATLKGSGSASGLSQGVRRARRLKETFTAKWAIAWAARELFPALHRRHRERNGFQSIIRNGLVLPEPVVTKLAPGSDPVRQRLLQDHAHDILPGLLHYGDAISMAHSIETRHPFLDYRLVEWFFTLPTLYKLYEGESKWVLRQYLRGSGQADIGNRVDKKGYPTPVDDWLKNGARPEIEAILLKKHGPVDAFCDPLKVRGMLDRHRAGALGTGHHLYKLLSTQLWYERCIAQEDTR